MATSETYIKYVCEQLEGIGNVRYRKMFGEYMVYVNDKPVLIVCDDITYVKKLDVIKDLMVNAEVGRPYNGAKEHYVLDIDNSMFSKDVVKRVEEVTSLPKKKKKS